MEAFLHRLLTAKSDFPTWVRYTLTLGLVGIAFIARVMLDDHLRSYPFLLFIPAIFLSPSYSIGAAVWRRPRRALHLPSPTSSRVPDRLLRFRLSCSSSPASVSPLSPIFCEAHCGNYPKPTCPCGARERLASSSVMISCSSRTASGSVASRAAFGIAEALRKSSAMWRSWSQLQPVYARACFRLQPASRKFSACVAQASRARETFTSQPSGRGLAASAITWFICTELLAFAPTARPAPGRAGFLWPASY